MLLPLPSLPPPLLPLPLPLAGLLCEAFADLKKSA